jgi:hypothetical protein
MIVRNYASCIILFVKLVGRPMTEASDSDPFSGQLAVFLLILVRKRINSFLFLAPF